MIESNRKRAKRYALYSGLCILMLLVFGGCGGSTRGTGGVTVAGRVLNTDGAPVAGVMVTILETGDSATSGSDGSFAIESNVESEIGLAFERDDFSTSVSLRDIPSDARRVEAVFTIDEELDTVETSQVVIEREEEDDDDDDGGSGSTGSSGSGSGGPGTGGSSGGDDDSGDSLNEEDDDDDGSEDSSSDSSDDDSDDGDDEINDDSSGSGDVEDDDDDSAGSGSSDEDSSNSGSGSESGGEEDDHGDEQEEDCENEDVEGVISTLSASSITVAGISFVITPETEFEDLEGEDSDISAFSVGDIVRVRAECEESSLVAKRVELQD